MCNLRRPFVYVFLVLVGALIPLADADACRRGRCVRDCGSATPCATVPAVAAHRAAESVFTTVTPPIVKGNLYDTNGALLTKSVTINIFNSTPVQIGTVTTS